MKKPAFVWLGLVLLIIWFFRPLVHPLVMAFYVSPLRLILFIALGGGFLLLTKQIWPIQWVQIGPLSYTLKARKLNAWKLWAYLGILGFIIGGLSFESEIRYLVTAKSIGYEKRADLPIFSPIRLIPKSVATRYAEDTFQNPQEHLGDPQIVLVDNTLKRVFPRLPDGALLYLFNKMTGFVTVDVDTLERKVDSSDQQFKYSEGIGVFDNVYYQLLLKKYWVSYSSEPIYLKNENQEWITVVPYMSYSGLIFKVPEWGGVMVIKSDGSIEDYSPQQAQEIGYMKGNRIYPKELTVYYAHSYAYRGGLLNKWFLHKDQTEVVSLPNNEALFHLSTTEGFKQVVVAEPYGRSYGIFKIFIFDASTGRREVIEYDQTSRLTGPIAAADYIKKEFPTFDWSSFNLSEPRPININDELHWLLSVVPNDSAGIAATVLLNAKTNQVIRADSLKEVQSVISGGVVPDGSDTPVPSNQDQIRERLNNINQELEEIKDLLD